MPRYAPLPRVELDPRAEAELVKASARRVYEASSATINDFSSGSPIMALLEGQAFAQAEFLQFANQFPESVLVEWIGPFLGAQRRTGAGAVVDVTFTITPSDQAFQVFEGFQLATDSRLTGGEVVKFVTLERLTIPKNATEGTVRCVAIEMGIQGNVPPRSITKSLTSLAGVESVTNREAATGGLNAELMSEVKERFFSLIRRRNPVSSEDWVDWFSDALGTGTSVKVLPRHSERDTYSYDSDYIVSNPSVSFFVLNPDGTPITEAQKNALETLMKWSLPVEFLGYTYPMEVGEMDIVLDLDYDPAKPYAQNREDLSRQLRNNLFAILTPNAVFPIEYHPTATDIESALTSSFPVTLGVSNRFTDPDVQTLYGYHTPVHAAINTTSGLSPIPFEAGPRIRETDLIVEETSEGFKYYEVLNGFDPIPNDKAYHVNSGNLDLKYIKTLSPGDYSTGDVISLGDDGRLLVCANPFSYDPQLTAEQLVARGYLLPPKDYTAFSGELSDGLLETGKYNPDLIQFVQGDLEGVTRIPFEPAGTLPQYRPGHPIFVAKGYFMVGESSVSLGEAQQSGNISSDPVNVQNLVHGGVYTAGSYVRTPDPNKLIVDEINYNSCYVSKTEGASVLHLQIQQDLTFVVPDGQTYSESVSALSSFGPVRVVDVISFSDCGGFPAFKNDPFRHRARFAVGEYVRYRPTGGDESSDLHRYYQALVDFTPNTQDVDELVENNLMVEVPKSTFESTYTVFIDDYTQTYSFNITQALIDNGQLTSVSDLNNGDSCLVSNYRERERGLFEWKSGQWVKTHPGLPTYRDLFRFAPGDVANFRQGSVTKSYRALSHVTPIFNPIVYVEAGLFAEEQTLTSTVVRWLDPDYRMETICYDKSDFGAFSFYRAIRSENPPQEMTKWNNTLAAGNIRLSELRGNLLKIVVKVGCNEEFMPRLVDGASSLKLGHFKVNLKSKDSSQRGDTFVMETGFYASEVPEFSYSPTISWDKEPIDYGEGTLDL